MRPLRLATVGADDALNGLERVMRATLALAAGGCAECWNGHRWDSLSGLNKANTVIRRRGKVNAMTAVWRSRRPRWGLLTAFLSPIVVGSLNQPEPVAEQELDALRQERDAAHDGIGKAGTERDHQHPDSHSRGPADKALVLD